MKDNLSNLVNTPISRYQHTAQSMDCRLGFFGSVQVGGRIARMIVQRPGEPVFYDRHRTIGALLKSFAPAVGGVRGG